MNRSNSRATASNTADTTDSVDARFGRITRAMLLLGIVIACMVLFANIAEERGLSRTMWVVIAVIPIQIGLLVLARLGRTQAATIGLASMICLIMVGVVLARGTVRVPAASLIILMSALSGLVLERRQMIVILAAGILLLGGLTLAEQQGLLRPAPASPLWSFWLTISIFAAATGGILSYGRDMAENALARARNEIVERGLVERSLRESEAHLRVLIEKALAGMYVARDGRFLYANPRLEEILGYGPNELVGVSVDDLVLPEDLPIMHEARDKLKAGASSVAYALRARRKDGAIIELGVQGLVTDFDGEPAIVGMAQDIGERSRAQAEIKQYIARLERTTQGTLEAVALMVEQRDPYTAGHERRVGELAAAIGAEMGLSEDTVNGLRLAGYVHDVGKISVPAELLSKPTRLTPLEFQLIKGHSQNGYDVLKNVDFPWPVAEVILQHHERLDGSGYPRQLKGEQIIIEARIMSVADVVEAMSSHRPYRPGLGMEAALGEIENNSSKLYDPKVVAACLHLIRDKAYVLPV